MKIYPQCQDYSSPSTNTSNSPNVSVIKVATSLGVSQPVSSNSQENQGRSDHTVKKVKNDVFSKIILSTLHQGHKEAFNPLVCKSV